MKLELHWQAPIRVVNGAKAKLIYHCNLAAVPEEPGVYAFCRRFGDTIKPLYIGKAKNLRKRIDQHFKHSTKLMVSIRDHAKIGKRILLVGAWTSKGGQQQASALSIIERALIRAALVAGHDLFNYQGTVIRSHQIEMEGSKVASRLFGRSVRVDK